MTTEPAERMLPLYEGKMIHHFDHRWATHDESGGTRDLDLADKRDPHATVLPRYWVAEAQVTERLAARHDPSWLLGFRNITNVTNERSVLAAAFPRSAVGHGVPLLFALRAALLQAELTSLALDYVLRQKLGGTNLTYNYFQQLPTVTPAVYDIPAPWAPDAPLADWVVDRVLELVYTAWDLEPFALDLYDDGPPFRWDEQRRAQLRAELDAAYFSLYGLDRDDTAYMLDTFPIVRRKDEAAHGEYRTKRLVLEAYDALAEAARTGTAYVSPLDPPPGDGPRHPAREDLP